MRLFSLEENGFPKTILILVVLFLVASGLCGVQWIFGMSSFGGNLGPIIIPLGVVELIAMLLSAGGIVVVSILWIGSAIYARFSERPKNTVQTLFTREDEAKNEDEK
jgi:hypothetical protein